MNAKFNQEFDYTLSIEFPKLEDGKDLLLEIFSSSQVGVPAQFDLGNGLRGVRLKGPNIAILKEASQTECEEACQDNAECIFWISTSGIACFLRTGLEEISFKDSVTAGGITGNSNKLFFCMNKTTMHIQYNGKFLFHIFRYHWAIKHEYLDRTDKSGSKCGKSHKSRATASF